MELKHTTEELTRLQKLPLDVKVELTKQRVREFVEQVDAFVAFSGGKGSAVLLDIVRSEWPDMPAMFIDTGLEFPEIREFVKTFDNVDWVKPNMNFREVVLKHGYPLVSKECATNIESARRSPNSARAQRFIEGSESNMKYPRYTLVNWAFLKDSDIPVSAYCCDAMKKLPSKAYTRKTKRYPITGDMACESSVRKQSWQRTGCNNFHKRKTISKPMSFWTEQDVLQYIKERNLRIAPVYGDIIGENGKLVTTGCRRTGCVFCAFGAHLEKEPNRFQRLAVTHPKLWEYCMKPVDRGGLGMAEPLDFIGVNWRPVEDKEK